MSDDLSPAAQEKLLKLQLRLAQIEKNEKSQKNFLDFVKAVWPDFISGRHHRIIAEKLERVASGDLKRLIINMPPRHTKSEFASYLFPAWFMGRAPGKQIIQATHTTELAVGFGRKTKNLIESDAYRTIFPDVRLATDSKASGRWNTNKGGSYYAVGVGSNLAGRGADLCIHPDTLVETPQGPMRACEIRVGDDLLGVGGFGRVKHVLRSRHTATVCLNGSLLLSDFHPVMTDKGWVPAKNLEKGGVVYAPQGMVNKSSMVIKGEPIHDDEFCARVQRLGHDAPAVHESERGELSELWGPGYHGRSQMGPVQEFLGRHGARPLQEAHSGPSGQRRAVFSGELCLVGPRKTAEQSPEQCFHRSVWGEEDSGAVGAVHGPYTRYDQAPGLCHGDDAGGSPDRRKNVAPPEEGGAVDSGRSRGPSVRVSGRYRKGRGFQPTGCPELYFGTGENLWWVPVEIRSVERTEHGPRDFVNFHVDGSNTFIANSYLTHNCIIDDPHSEQTAMSTSGFDDAWDWYTGGPRQRLQPGGSIVLVQTRWSEKDMTGQLLRAMAKDPLADQWEVVELPAVFEDGTPCWPEFWSLEDLNAVKASIPPSKWNAQYQQNPTGDDNAIIPREWWQRWTGSRVPQLQYVIQSYDTAFSKRETSDFSAITTWGVFYPNEGGSGPNLILLDSKKGRWDFPELKHLAFESYQFWEPDTVIVEAKASGMPLTHELRQTGIPVVNFTPSRGNDKLTRVHSVAPLFEAGMVWAPDEAFADEMIEEVAAFPNGEYDDLVDSMTQALMRYRQGNFVQLPTDDWEDEDKSVRLRSYY